MYKRNFRPTTANKILPEVYHGSTIIHRTPGRHTNVSFVRSASSKKVELSRVQSSVLYPDSPTKSIKLKKLSQVPQKNQRRIPMTKAEGEMILFREIFVRPKEEKLEQLKLMMEQEHFGDLLFDKKLGISAKPLLTEIDNSNGYPNLELKSIPEKSSFFEHQIQVQPPEGLNATIAAPLTPGGGWAPSIPPSSSSLKSIDIKDLTLRAKSGLQAGDVQREAHMSYALATLNEQKFNYLESLKFYKKFFLCAKILDDPIGAALALNRLGIVYYNLGKIDKSIKFHLKHAEFSDKQNKFAAFYNLGISYRHLNNLQESIKYLNKSLSWANKRMDAESQFITLGQLGISFKMLGDYNNALHNLENCLKFARNFKNQELQMETCIVLGSLCYDNLSLDLASKYFNEALIPARNIGNNHIIDICSCNLGIVDASIRFSAVQSNIMERCKSTNKPL
jgi:tetratricopeptide (TPR) repeat protein